MVTKAYRLFLLLTLVALVAFVSTPARADSVSFEVNGVNGTGVSANVTIDVTGTTLTITIENTTDAGVGGVITGFGFNLPSGTATFVSASGTLNDSAWHGGTNMQADSVGQFDALGLTGTNINGGNPPSGIALGGTGTFVFTLSSGSVTAAGILNELSFCGSCGNAPGGTPFVVRFQAINGGLSDFAIVPEPATLGMVGTGLFVLGGAIRRRFAKK